METSSLEVRKHEELESALLEADSMIMKKYMNGISRYDVKEITPKLAALDLNSVFRLNKVEKLVYNAEENNLEKLMNVYNAVGLSHGSIVNIIVSDGYEIEYYIGTRANNTNGAATCQDTLARALNGNFPGSTVTLQKKKDMQCCIDEIFANGRKSVTVVSGIPGYRDEDNKDNKKFIQGMERVIDSMAGRPFALITISEPLSSDEIATIRRGYENLYTQISPFAATQLSYNESDSMAVAETITDGITETVGQNVSTTISKSTTDTKGEGKNSSTNLSLIGLFGYSKGENNSHSSAVQEGKTNTSGTNVSQAKSNSVGKTDTYTNTTGRTLQISIENKTVKSLMDRIDGMIERIDDSADLGLWNTATYCIADNSQTSQVLASAVESICRGDKASIESFAVETWTESRKSDRVIAYLSKLVHPVILVNVNKGVFEVNPSSLVNGKELVIEAGLPQKSVPGVPVSEMVAFSRNVVCDAAGDGDSVKLGKIYHMGQAESTLVNLNVESLSAHTLITGSTGSGKSNTVYHMLNELIKQGIKFLVVEPAKGEYKNVFGNRSDVKVYGTNEKFADLLRINPFKFPKSVHVLEHIDRLIEIFNVCWPMYAAMPAVLKDAVLCAYESCGWDLEESENIYGDDIYPTFKDLQRELITVLNRSAYSEEVKGNYIGSLATRVKSLTNGINGKIFTNSAVEYADLFDENVIIDLSRVGSAETKSLIMGLVVMALNEYRMDQSLSVMNQKLKHVTVLEEAHNLLRNVSSSGSEGEGNMAGKSVEMITNSIAEMRTYGEGFIIVDQSPSAIDISAIRNTNTKIIMRLPEDSDRKQAGKSAGLKEDQIDEIAKLYRGVAVVYQNNWLDPVLCAIEKADIEELPYIYEIEKMSKKKADHSDLLKMLMKNRVDEKLDFDMTRIEENLERTALSTKTRLALRSILKEVKEGKDPIILQNESFKELSDIVVDLLDCREKLSRFSEYGSNCDLLQQELNREIEKSASEVSKEVILAISQCIIREIVEEDSSQVDLYTTWREYAVEQRRMV